MPTDVISRVSNVLCWNANNRGLDKMYERVLEEILPWLFQRNFSSAELQETNNRKQTGLEMWARNTFCSMFCCVCWCLSLSVFHRNSAAITLTCLKPSFSPSISTLQYCLIKLEQTGLKSFLSQCSWRMRNCTVVWGNSLGLWITSETMRYNTRYIVVRLKKWGCFFAVSFGETRISSNNGVILILS